MTDKESEQFIRNARIKHDKREKLSEAEKLILTLVDNGRDLSNNEIEAFIYFMDNKYEQFRHTDRGVNGINMV